MDDARIWDFEESLWTGDADHYRALIDDHCLMVLPSEPHVVTGAQAIAAVAATPRWSRVDLSDRQVMRPEEGLIVIAYHARASNAGADEDKVYEAYCTTTIRRRAHEDWVVVQHSQLPPVKLGG